MRGSFEHRRRSEALDREALQAYQLTRVNELLATILPTNSFYAEKLAGLALPLRSFEQLAELPMTVKDELSRAPHTEGGALATPANLTWPIDQYVRFHQTSGTHGKPLGVFDTEEDWQWWMDCWQYVLDAAEVTSADRVMLAFSFGPFIGFWSARDALVARGTLVVPGGGMNTLARLDLMQRTATTVLLCTPTYALHLVEVAEEHKINLGKFAVERIIVAGEPGGSVESVRSRIETAWQARVTDHSGASEVGPWGYGDPAGKGLYVLESEFLAEFYSVEHEGSAAEGELAHLVLTSLGRYGMPILRYRTGDLVRPRWSSESLSSEEVPSAELGAGTNRFVFLDGGVLGRADDMMVIRGVNIFPSSVEQILRSFPEVTEYRLTVRKRGEMDELIVEVEDRLQSPQRIAEELGLRLGLKVEVRLAPAMSLPRFEGKARRFIDQRGA
ncbi:phenylacetate--CoA ligase family protein [Adhaeretor mobilis]|uniref:Phenylacetate-coenzyme A ligase n=1 Tax=Adhaeretor mobilis TaxID=1930276 RepID=A0A517N0W3_9BACT|nr:AMP-binding protein [Adhaeretor mobilis]QDT00775.1 Phenylacetate-coenzyme A ligase [Adhaeretor mobilis]